MSKVVNWAWSVHGEWREWRVASVGMCNSVNDTDESDSAVSSPPLSKF